MTPIIDHHLYPPIKLFHDISDSDKGNNNKKMYITVILIEVLVSTHTDEMIIILSSESSAS